MTQSLRKVKEGASAEEALFAAMRAATAQKAASIRLSASATAASAAKATLDKATEDFERAEQSSIAAQTAEQELRTRLGALKEEDRQTAASSTSDSMPGEQTADAGPAKDQVQQLQDNIDGAVAEVARASDELVRRRKEQASPLAHTRGHQILWPRQLQVCSKRAPSGPQPMRATTSICGTRRYSARERRHVSRISATSCRAL